MTMPLFDREFDANLKEPGNDAIVGVTIAEAHDPDQPIDLSLVVPAAGEASVSLNAAQARQAATMLTEAAGALAQAEADAYLLARDRENQ